jgi:low temperature requirement protein LtrA
MRPLRPITSILVDASSALVGSADHDAGSKRSLLRERGEGLAEVRPIELFFDLVYVLAITQLTRQLVGDLTLRGAGETLLLLPAAC